MIAQQTGARIDSFDQLTIDGLENEWIQESVIELARRLRREPANMDAFDPLCGWLSDASGSTTVVERSMLAQAFEQDLLFSKAATSRAEWLYALLEEDGAGKLLLREELGRVHRILCRWAELRGIVL